MSRRVILVLALVAGAGAVVAGCGGDDSGGGSAAATDLAQRTVAAGEVDVTIDVEQLDAGGAAFAIKLDTHSVELDMDLADGSTLTVGGVEWGPATWSGDGSGGHHREGTLRFPADGDDDGPVRLELGGFDEPVVAEWER